jgi:hypothetical protein
MPSRASLLRRRAELLEEQARVDRELADLEERAVLPGEFSSINLPPGTSRRSFREGAKLIVGAYRQGHVWHVSREAWFAARAKPARKAVALVAPSSDVDALIESAGLRITRRSA